MGGNEDDRERKARDLINTNEDDKGGGKVLKMKSGVVDIRDRNGLGCGGTH